MVKREEIVKKVFEKKGIIDAHTHIGIHLRNYVNFAFPYCLSVEDLIVRMDYLGISFSVVFPMDSTYYAASRQPSGKVRINTKLSKFPYEIENLSLLKEIYEIFPEYSERVLPFLLFDPSRKTKKQAKFMERLYEKYPVFGLKTIPSYIQSYVRDIEKKGKPILDFVRKHNLPITFHCAYYKKDPWASVFDIIDFAERNKDIRICIAHTARFVKSVLDRASSLKNCFVDLSAFYIHCVLASQNSPVIPPEDERFPADYGKPEMVLKKLVEE